MLRDFFLGSIKIHILYHADIEPIYGAFLMEELAHHGYDVSPGTLYPTLKQLHSNGFLDKYEKTVNGKVRKYYTLTEEGKELLEEAKHQIRELAAEVLHDEWGKNKHE